MPPNRTRSITTRPSRSALTLLVALACACSSPDPQLLATIDGSNITIDDVTAQIEFESAEGNAPPSDLSRHGIEKTLRRIAVARILLQAAQPLGESAELHLRISLLATGVMHELMAKSRPTDQEIQAAATSRQQNHQSETRYTFEHIYLRIEGQTTDTRRRAQRILQAARLGGDFAELAREHSQSANASRGGKVSAATASTLDGKALQVLQNLAPGDLSPVVETRTGFHLFHLLERTEATSMSAAEHRSALERELLRQKLLITRSSLLTELRTELEPEMSATRWKVGEWSLDESSLPALLSRLGAGPVESRRQELLELLLLAVHAQNQGRETTEFELRLQREKEREQVETARRLEVESYLASLGDAQLQPVFDQQPDRFNSPPSFTLDLIFVSKEGEPFDQQRELLDVVHDLRTGNAEWEEVARTRSNGPPATQGASPRTMSPSDLTALHPFLLRSLSTMQPGEVSDPVYCPELDHLDVELSGGFGILRLHTMETGMPRTFEQAADDVRRAYAMANAQKVAQDVEQLILDRRSFKIIRIPNRSEFVPTAKAPRSSTAG